MTPLQILDGRVLALFAFDVGDAIDLEAIPAVLRPERAQLVRRRPAPAYVQYAVPPVEIALGERPVRLPAGDVAATVSARLFDFGAVSLTFALPAPTTLAALADVSHALATDADLVSAARAALQALVADIAPAIGRLGLNDLIEDYYVFQLARCEPALDADALLRTCGDTLAAVLSMDRGALSRQQVDETLRDAIAYSPHDLVAADWSAAVVYDTESADTVAVLEFLNVQLVELRFLDRRLDHVLDTYSGVVHRRRRGTWRDVLDPDRAAIHALSALTLETARLSERVENAVKLVPDVYLARVHRRSAARLGLPTWTRIVQAKLDAVRHLTGVLAERSAARRTEVLELTIIVLIALEIVLALAGRLGP